MPTQRKRIPKKRSGTMRRMSGGGDNEQQKPSLMEQMYSFFGMKSSNQGQDTNQGPVTNQGSVINQGQVTNQAGGKRKNKRSRNSKK